MPSHQLPQLSPRTASRSLFPGAQSERFLFCLFVWPGAGACGAQLCNFTKAFGEKTGDSIWQKGTGLEGEAADLGVGVEVLCACVYDRERER